MSPADYGRQLAATRPPLSDEQVEQAARVFAAEPLEMAA